MLAFGIFLLLLRLALTRKFDRRFATGLTAMGTGYIASFLLAVTAGWTHLSLQIVSH